MAAVRPVVAPQPARAFEMTLDDGRYVVHAAPGFERDAVSDDLRNSLIERLVMALRETGTAIAVASPFARGGRFRDPSWLARVATTWENAFLSLAAHGELATVIGTVRVYRKDALARITATCSGDDLDAQLLLEARKQGIRITEVPADLTRTPEPNGFSVRALRAAARRLWAHVSLGLRYRPALWLALPGLVPGPLPLIVGLLLMFRVTPSQAAFWIIVTLIVQYGSLAIFSWQTSSFIARRWLLRKLR